jgi:hypothetical protein
MLAEMYSTATFPHATAFRQTELSESGLKLYKLFSTLEISENVLFSFQ